MKLKLKWELNVESFEECIIFFNVLKNANLSMQLKNRFKISFSRNKKLFFISLKWTCEIKDENDTSSFIFHINSLHTKLYGFTNDVVKISLLNEGVYKGTRNKIKLTTNKKI